jgi:hypothetical protein
VAYGITMIVGFYRWLEPDAAPTAHTRTLTT